MVQRKEGDMDGSADSFWWAKTLSSKKRRNYSELVDLCEKEGNMGTVISLNHKFT